jgi:hypothetical protein
MRRRPTTSVDGRTVLGMVVLTAGMAVLYRVNGGRLEDIATLPTRWVEIAKGPVHGPPL